MQLNSQNYPIRNSEYELTELDDEFILCSASKEKAVYLNVTAHLVWSLCNGQNSISDLIELLEEHYPDDENITSHVQKVLKKMVDDSVVGLSEKMVHQLD